VTAGDLETRHRRRS